MSVNLVRCIAWVLDDISRVPAVSIEWE